MILTQCAVCATELGLTLGKKCGRCSTRYCGPECQVQHWKEGGHDKLCRKIKKAGGAETYNANKKYAEAVAVAAEACANETRGQTCYICMEAVHSRTREGLVRGCACGDRDGVASGRTGIAHVSCLAEQAKILVAEAEENNLGNEEFDERWRRWDTCSLCKQDYHGVVACALGLACWKTYVGCPVEAQTRRMAISVLGSALALADHLEDAVSVKEAELSKMRRLGVSEHNILITQSNLASTYGTLGRLVEASRIQQDVYSGHVKLNGEEHKETLGAATNYATSLLFLDRFEEARSLLRKTVPVARRVLGEDHELTLMMRKIYAGALCKGGRATFNDLREAVRTYEDTKRIARRVLGGAHPLTVDIENNLRCARAHEELFRAHATGDMSSLREALAAMPPPGSA